MLAITVFAAAVIIRQWKGELLPLLRVGITLLFGTLAISAVTPFVSFLREITVSEGFSTHSETLLKALGIAILTQYCAQICREGGEAAIADGVELTGKIEILLLCLPLIREILSVAKEMLALGGGT